MKPHWLLIGGVAVFVCLILYVIFRDRVTAWWTRVSNTEGGKRALEDVGDIEEWIKKTRAGIDAHKASSPVVAASAAAADPPAAETSPPPGPAAPSIAESAAPSAIGGTPLPAARAAPQEKSMPVEDKGVVSAGQLLSGWVLANWETNTEPVPAKRHADLMYLAQMARKPGGNMVFEDVVIGNQGEINVCKNYSHTNGWDAQVIYNYDGSYKDWGAEADKAVVAAAQASVAAYLASHPSFSRTYDFSARRRP